eukprot:scaffold50690_cov17-Tisochrysis_lutea.AAC.1
MQNACSNSPAATDLSASSLQCSFNWLQHGMTSTSPLSNTGILSGYCDHQESCSVFSRPPPACPSPPLPAGCWLIPQQNLRENGVHMQRRMTWTQ